MIRSLGSTYDTGNLLLVRVRTPLTIQSLNKYKVKIQKKSSFKFLLVLESKLVYFCYCFCFKNIEFLFTLDIPTTYFSVIYNFFRKMAEDAESQCKISEILQKLNLDRLELPEYLKKLLIYTGFDNITSLANFNENDDIIAVQHFARSELPDLLDEKEKAAFYGIYANNIGLFKIPLGHRKLLNMIVDSCKKYYKKDLSENMKRKLGSSVDLYDSKKIKVTSTEEPSTSKSDDGSQIPLENKIKDEDKLEIINHVKKITANYIRSFLNCLSDSEKKFAALSKLNSLIVEFENQIALVHCPECNFVSRTFTSITNGGKRKLVLSNFNKHYRRHFISQKSSKSKWDDKSTFIQLHMTQSPNSDLTLDAPDLVDYRSPNNLKNEGNWSGSYSYTLEDPTVPEETVMSDPLSDADDLMIKLECEDDKSM